MLDHPLAVVPRTEVGHLTTSYYAVPPKLDLPLYLTPQEIGPEDREIAARVLAAFKRATELESKFVDLGQTEGVWEIVKRTHHVEAYRLLFEEDVEGLAAYLCNGLRRTICYGFVLGPNILRSLEQRDSTAWPHLLLIKDRLVALAVALGVLPHENPEQGRYGQNIHIEFRELISRIEECVGFKIHRSPIMGNFGVLLDSDQLIDSKVSEDTYSTIRLRELMHGNSVAEIGGGFGGAAYFNVLAGLRTTIFDLPIINVVQSYFLIKTLGASKVRLLDELNPSAVVSVLPWLSFFDRENTFDIAFNRDSMSEFQREVAERYLREIQNRQVPFLSINQEVENLSGDRDVHQLNVGHMARAAGLVRSVRMQYWLRRGYVEEFFQPSLPGGAESAITRRDG